MDVIGLGVTALVVVGVIAAVVALALAPRRAAASGGATVRVAAWVGVAWAAISGAAALYVVLTTLFAPGVSITIPVQSFWPALPDGTTYEGTTATLEQGGFTTADVTLLGLSLAVRIGWAISQALWCLIPGAIAVLVAMMAFRLRRGEPFAHALVRAATATAVVIALGGVAAQVTGDLAGIGAAEQLLRWSSASYPDLTGFPDSDLSTWLPRPGSQITFPFWPLAAGLGFAALAALLHRAEALQQTAAALERETEGLV